MCFANKHSLPLCTGAARRTLKHTKTMLKENDCFDMQTNLGTRVNMLRAFNTTCSQLVYIYWNTFFGGLTCNSSTQTNARFLTQNQSDVKTVSDRNAWKLEENLISSKKCSEKWKTIQADQNKGIIWSEVFSENYQKVIVMVQFTNQFFGRRDGIVSIQCFLRAWTDRNSWSFWLWIYSTSVYIFWSCIEYNVQQWGKSGNFKTIHKVC